MKNCSSSYKKYHIISTQVLQASIPCSCFFAGDELAIYSERRIGNPYAVQRKSMVFFLICRFIILYFYFLDFWYNIFIIQPRATLV